MGDLLFPRHLKDAILVINGLVEIDAVEKLESKEF